jgi:hypothetical protein
LPCHEQNAAWPSQACHLYVSKVPCVSRYMMGGKSLSFLACSQNKKCSYFWWARFFPCCEGMQSQK